MHVTIVHVCVKADYVNEFIKACQVNHERSVQELGNMRFDVLQCADDPTRFVLYEAYQSRQQAIAHKATGHYLTWRATVADWMSKARVGVDYNGLYPKVTE
ncbi:MAG: antibiotic biosynthesis monooxygenase [Gammaproteobacteria bacterium]|nr:antibiotic biosynthesis monooxygenase [Gammaproteobacteria bacterium]